MCITLHFRASHELSAIGAGFDAAFKCVSEAINLWSKINSNALERSLSPIEHEELRLMVFSSFLDKSKLIRLRQTFDCDEIRKCISGAMEFVQSISNIRLTFLRHVMELGHFLATRDFMEEAAHYFKIVLNIIDISPKVEKSQVISDKSEMQAIKIRAQLSLSYVYQELRY